jgi:hypothetical protein
MVKNKTPAIAKTADRTTAFEKTLPLYIINSSSERHLNTRAIQAARDTVTPIVKIA